MTIPSPLPSLILKRSLPLLLIFLLAWALRSYQLTAVPPGLTHDEANHGREAMGVLDGVTPFFFPYNYGSEPLYSYTVAGSMALFGENLLALRLVNVLFGLGAMVVAYLWSKRAFDRRTALIAAAVTAVSFWPVASSREALRAGMLPFFMTAAVWFFWQILQKPKKWAVVGFAACVAFTIHIYLAARVAWLVFPIFLIYLWLIHRDSFQKSWRPMMIGLVGAGILVTPMFIYLRQNPDIITRLEMLDGPLQNLRRGEWRPLLQNGWAALLAFVWPGYGDQFLAYNIPGRPVFDGVTAVFFAVGILVSLARWRQRPYAFLLLWFGVGIIPSLITGPTANTTRNLAALSAVHLLPAVGFMALVDGLGGKRRPSPLGRPYLLAGVTAVWIGLAGFFTARDYFGRWGQSPEVRGAYQHTLVETIAYLEAEAITGPLSLSTVYPSAAHDPSISLALAPQPDWAARWMDARYALIWPGGAAAQAIIPDSTPLHPALAALLRPLDAISLRPDDLDPGFTRYQWNVTAAQSWLPPAPLANFGDGVMLLTAQWLTPATAPGSTAEMLTIWQVTDPARVGPRVPPANLTDVVLFTQVLTTEGQVLAQRDALDAPSWDWQSGDIIFQIHPITLPPDAAPGRYQTIVGVYDRLSGNRLPVVEQPGVMFAEAPPLLIQSP